MSAKTVLITGTSSGIGRAAVGVFADAGWNVVATMRKPTPGIFAGRANVLTRRLDVQDDGSIELAIDAGLEQFGQIDLLINNAGFGLLGVFETMKRQQIQEQFDVNLFGVMDVTRAILPHYRARQSGMIINVSSGAGMFTMPLLSMYCASKFALEGFTEGLSYELASQNIVVKLVIPHGGVTETAFGASTAEYSQTNSAIDDYDDFVQETQKQYKQMISAASISSRDVARLILLAATDGTEQLRYLIGDDARGFVKARREMKEQEYIAFMRNRFAIR